ncbi:MAG: hypothetical protein V5A59_12800, partial [Bacteroidales bacterium]|nr:hypothetical protein [Bacteroidales bacterium]
CILNSIPFTDQGSAIPPVLNAAHYIRVILFPPGFFPHPLPYFIKFEDNNFYTEQELQLSF